MSIRLSAVLFPTLWLMAGFSLVAVLFIARLSLLESALDIPWYSNEVLQLSFSLQLTMWLCAVFAILYFVVPNMAKHSMNIYLSCVHMGGTLLLLIYIPLQALRFAWMCAIHRYDNSCYSYDGGTPPTGYVLLGLAFIAQVSFIANILMTFRRSQRPELIP